MEKVFSSFFTGKQEDNVLASVLEEGRLQCLQGSIAGRHRIGQNQNEIIGRQVVEIGRARGIIEAGETNPLRDGIALFA